MIFFSCKKDDTNITNIPLEDLSQQYTLENDSIIQFMKSHFFNYDDFNDLSPNDSPEIVFDSIIGDNLDKTPIYDQVSTLQISVKDTDDNLVNHNLYYHIIREGIGENPTVADSVFVSYKGLLLDGVSFDTRKNPIWMEAKNLIRGFQEFLPLLSKGDVRVNNNGTYEFFNFGIGFAIFPSGLGYFQSGSISIPAYSPLIFKVNMMTLNRTDHDNDSVLTIIEDLNGDHDFNNDDTDSDNIPNFLDDDDDGDGVLTINEYDLNKDGIPDDTDGDGIPDYIDLD
jgi:hypothetical protein|tara:strand:- start:1231 stop:2079 length:849 start_codon:yes stop_codon:yes gene_type:complete